VNEAVPATLSLVTASFSLILEGVIRDICGGTRPRHHQAVLVEQETQFPANNPAMLGEAFAADLLGARVSRS
jgi:hypothetical protein